MKEGGMDKLKGKKIVNIYHDSAYGKETIPILDAQAKKYGSPSRTFRWRTPATSRARNGCKSGRSSPTG
jgi:branched-chain amino acid transport system substrate-binding protein